MNLFDGGYPMPDDHIDPDEVYDKIISRIRSLQNRRYYADAETAEQLTAEIERLLDIIEPQQRQGAREE